MASLLAEDLTKATSAPQNSAFVHSAELGNRTEASRPPVDAEKSGTLSYDALNEDSSGSGTDDDDDDEEDLVSLPSLTWGLTWQPWFTRTCYNPSRKRVLNITMGALAVLSVLQTAILSMDSMDLYFSENPQAQVVNTIVSRAFDVIFVMELFLRITLFQFKYAFSLMGVIDFIVAVTCIFTAFVNVTNATSQKLRTLNLLRVFRVFKLLRFVMPEVTAIRLAVAEELRMVGCFAMLVIMGLLTIASAMYVIEDGSDGFGSIPMSMWWATVTVATVGYGDIVPHTPVGRLLASFLMIVAYGILAVPTIMGSQLTEEAKLERAVESAEEAKLELVASARLERGAGRSAQSMPHAGLNSLGSRRRSSMSQLSRGRSGLSMITEGVPGQLRAQTPALALPPLASLPRGRFAYPFFVRLPTRPSDGDRHGFLTNTACLTLIEAAVSMLLAREAFRRRESPNVPQAIVIESAFRILTPLALQGDVFAGVAVESVGAKSLSYRVALCPGGSDVVSVLGRLAQVWKYDLDGDEEDVPNAVRSACAPFVIRDGA